MAKIANVFQKEEVKKAVHPKRITKWIHYTKLIRNEKQYCDAVDKEEIEGLADVIEADGMVLQDLLVKKNDTDEYMIIAGHKRHAACKLLVEERGRKEFEFLPCFEQTLSDIRAEFQVYSSNCHHTETPYEIMHKLERMRFLLNEYPEEFPEIQGGRMVDRLAKKYNLSKSTVGEYLTISKNLGDTAMEEFEKGKIDKSAAVTLASMPEEQQNQALKQGYKKNKDLQKFKKEILEPSVEELVFVYEAMKIGKFYTSDNEALCERLVDSYGNAYSIFENKQSKIEIGCTPETIILNGKEIAWRKFVQLLHDKVPEKDLAKGWELYVDKGQGYVRCNQQVTTEVFRRLEKGDQSCLLIKGEWESSARMLNVWTIEKDGSESEMDFEVTYVNTKEAGLKEGYSLLNLTAFLPFN